MIFVEGTANGVCAAIHLYFFSSKYKNNLGVKSALPYERYMPSTFFQPQVNNTEDEATGDDTKCVLCDLKSSGVIILMNKTIKWLTLRVKFNVS